MNKDELGLFLAIEGTDGAGKNTQATLLIKRLENEGYQVASFDFPRYDQPSSYFVRQYLNGEYGSGDDVGPYVASMFYALDRYEAAPQIREALEAGKIVVANRYAGSNMAHQGTKFDNAEQRRGYFIWLDQIEFEMLGIPRPSQSLVLRVPAETAQKLVDHKQVRSYTDKKRDLHEADLEHLRKSVEVYDNLCQLFPKDFKALDCARGGKILAKETIANLIWETVMPLLPSKDQSSKTKVQESPNPYVTKTKVNGQITTNITVEGQTFLKEVLTNTDGNVYAFNEKLSPLTIAAAMARLSRRADDMRVTLLDEFAMSAGKDSKLLQRVITAYGDDSVQQLVGQHVVVENASNILTKKLEWGRLAAYLEQSTRYIYFDKKDKHGEYRYYTPTNLDGSTKKSYETIMNQIYDLYSIMVRRLTDYVRTQSKVPEKERDSAWQGATRAQACDAVRVVLPVAVTSTVGIFASGQALESLIMHLLSDPMQEARTCGEAMLVEARKTIPAFLERADKPDRGGAMIAYRAKTAENVKALSNKYLADSHSTDAEAVSLTDVWPHNELDLIPDMLYEHSDASLAEITAKVDKLPYKKKQEIFKTYIGERLNRRHRPGRAIEKAHYSFDLVCDYGIFRDLQRHRMVDDLGWQQLTPRYGYDTPKLVEAAGLTDDFDKCFSLSLKLYSLLQDKGYAQEAQYATLLGHKMRWKLTMNAREAFHFIELRTAPQGHPGYRKLSHQMYEQICKVHPLLGAAMKFVNQDEDPELTRLAAERYTQFKLQRLN